MPPNSLQNLCKRVLFKTMVKTQLFIKIYAIETELQFLALLSFLEMKFLWLNKSLNYTHTEGVPLVYK